LKFHLGARRRNLHAVLGLTIMFIRVYLHIHRTSNSGCHDHILISTSDHSSVVVRSPVVHVLLRSISHRALSFEFPQGSRSVSDPQNTSVHPLSYKGHVYDPP
jgi:hypothetical protein